MRDTESVCQSLSRLIPWNYLQHVGLVSSGQQKKSIGGIVSGSIFKLESAVKDCSWLVLKQPEALRLGSNHSSAHWQLEEDVKSFLKTWPFSLPRGTTWRLASALARRHAPAASLHWQHSKFCDSGLDDDWIVWIIASGDSEWLGVRATGTVLKTAPMANSSELKRALIWSSDLIFHSTCRWASESESCEWR